MAIKEVNSAPYPKGLERQFAAMAKAMIEAMADTFENQTFKKLGKGDVEKFSDAKIGNYANVFLKLSKRAQSSILNRFDNDRLDRLVKDMLNKVNKANQNATYAAAGPALGIEAKALKAKEALTPEFNALVAETQVWIKKLRDETLEQFQANSLRAMTLGLPLDGVIDEFNIVKSKRKNAAELTARTQIASYNGLATKLRAQSLGITQAVWVTARDERVRKCHKVRDGKVYDLDTGLFSSCDGKTLYPGTDYNCRCTSKNIIETGEV